MTTLPIGYNWVDIDIKKESELKKLYNFLAENYVEYQDLYRFKYSTKFLKWALEVPDYIQEWHVSVQKNGEIMGFISAIPTMVFLCGKNVPVAEVNFLCVNKKLRKKRLMPVLSKEITRRIANKNFKQSIYTSGYKIQKPTCQAQYFHRFINTEKLIDIKFCSIPKLMTMPRMKLLYQIGDNSRLQKMTKEDIPQVVKLLNECNAKVFQKFTVKEAEHYFLNRPGIVSSFVLKENNTITAFASYYIINASVLNNTKHKNFTTAYLYYHTLVDSSLINDLLVMAKRDGADVFNALNVYQNKLWLKELKFKPGDGILNYFVHVSDGLEDITSKDINLILV